MSRDKRIAKLQQSRSGGDDSSHGGDSGSDEGSRSRSRARSRPVVLDSDGEDSSRKRKRVQNGSL